MSIKSFAQKVLQIFKRSHFQKESECYEIANQVLSNFHPDQAIDRDPCLRYGQRALVNAIVFCLCFDRAPDDLKFVRVLNLLEKSKREIEITRSNSETSLNFMYANANQAHKHAGWRELETFNAMGALGAHMVIKNVLSNSHTLRECCFHFNNT